MAYSLNPPLTARDGHTLRVVNKVRISGDKQDERSLEDQKKQNLDYLLTHWAGPIDATDHEEIAKGEDITRPGLSELKRIVRVDRPDVVLAEDSSRICRGRKFQDFLDICRDSGVRYLSTHGESIDSADDNIDVTAMLAGWKNEQSNKDTSNRIKRSQRQRFKDGQIVQCLPFGYVKPHAGCTAAEVRIDADARPHVEQMFALLEDGASYAEVARRLNADGVSTGKWVRKEKWEGVRVRELVHNSLLKGVRRRNAKESKRIRTTGKYVCVKADPELLLEDHQPHLAIIEPERWDRVTRMLKTRNAKLGRGKSVSRVTRGLPRKATVWPAGGHLRCGICGEAFVRGGNGGTDRLMCKGSRKHRCWNGTSVDTRVLAEHVFTAVIDELATLNGWPEELAKQVRNEAGRADVDRQRQLRSIDSDESKLSREIDNITHAIAAGSELNSLVEKLRSLEVEQHELQLRRDQLPPPPDLAAELPPVEEIVAAARELVTDIELEDEQLARRLRELLPELTVRPVRSVDGGDPEPRVSFTLDLSAAAGRPWLRESGLLEVRRMQVDCFDPPNRIRLLPEVLRLRGEGLTQRAVAERLGSKQPTVQKAEELRRKMQRLGTKDPYEVLNRPHESGRHRRHLHPDYQPPTTPSLVTENNRTTDVEDSSPKDANDGD